MDQLLHCTFAWNYHAGVATNVNGDKKRRQAENALLVKWINDNLYHRWNKKNNTKIKEPCTSLGTKSTQFLPFPWLTNECQVYVDC